MGRRWVWGLPFKLQRGSAPHSSHSTHLVPWRCIQRTVDVWPYRVWTHSPVSAFHTFKVRSVEPLITTLSLIWEDQTPPVCPTKVCTHYTGGKSPLDRLCGCESAQMQRENTAIDHLGQEQQGETHLPGDR